jgi:endonuclease/exonuclease/phosphatase family metal-dependent hydrolase
MLVALVILFILWAAAVFVLQPFGHRGGHFAVVATFLAGLVLCRWRALGPTPIRARGPGHPAARVLALCGTWLISGLACWLGLIAWSAVSTGGVLPSPKSDSRTVRVLTWNILVGSEHGAPWYRHGWRVRSRALEVALAKVEPDIFCVQEALSGQVGAIARMLPAHNHVGVGRDDGRSAGEYCAIFYDARRFQDVDGGTFWLEEPEDLPPSGFTLGPKRICTWVRLRDRVSGRFLRVYNTHLYLTETANRRAVRLIVRRISGGDPGDAVLVAGDFNAPPSAPSRRLFEEAGFVSTAPRADSSAVLPTYHFYGIRLRSLDDILCNRDWTVRVRRVLDVKPENTFPSDHFGVMADLVLEEMRR